MNKRVVLRRIHPLAGLLATTIILVFWTSTTGVLVFGRSENVVTVKHAIAWGLILLIPAMATTGTTGFALGQHSHDQRVLAKQRRMAFIAGVGLLVLVPCVLYLAATVSPGHHTTAFWVVQALELVAGGTNIALMTLNIRDGLRLTGRLRPRSQR